MILHFGTHIEGVAAERKNGAVSENSLPEDILRLSEPLERGGGWIHRQQKILLDEFEGLPGRISRPQTFMEIGGYPHYENVCSNFLAFFFDPEGPHGLSSLFLDALVGRSVSKASKKVWEGMSPSSAKSLRGRVTG